MLIGHWLLAAGPDSDVASREFVALLLALATGAVAWAGWMARRRVAATALASPVFGDTLLPFASLGGMAQGLAVPEADAPRARTLPRAGAIDEPALRSDALASFVRLLAAWDTADRAVLAALTTPAMYAELEPVLEAREAGAVQRTDVVTLDAKVVATESSADAAVATVLFSGLIRDRADAGAEPFRELWMLEREGADGGWKLAGQQTLF